MKTCLRSIASLVCLVATVWLAGCTNPAATEANATPKRGGADTPSGGIPILEVGLTTDAIRAKLGQPAEIRPMEPPQEMAEVWIYHVEGPMRVSQVITGMTSVPVMTAPGFEGQTHNVPQPQYSLAEKKSLVTLELLIYQGRLAAQKSFIDSKTSYN